LATITINAAMQAIGLLIFARTLGPAEYGIIVAATAVAAVAAEFVGAGSGDLLVREVSRAPSAHTLAFGRALRLIAVSIIPVSLLAALVAVCWFQADTSFFVMLILIATEIAATRMVLIAEQIAIAHHETHKANSIRIFGAATRFAVICAAVFGAQITTVSQWAAYSVVFASITTGGCLVLTIRRFGAPDLAAPLGSNFRIGIMFSLMHIIRAAQYSLDKFAVGWLAPGATVGAYGVASRTSQLAIMPASAINRITYPMFFQKGGEGLPSAVKLARTIAPAVIGVALLSCAGLVVVAFILPLVLGSAFTLSESYLLLLAAIPLFASLQNLPGDVLSGSDLQRHRVVATLVGLVLSIFAVIAGAHQGGVVGAILGYLVGQLLVAATLWITLIVARRANSSA
jgi:O-antigen/teichoic acid export membrane protein